MLIGLRVRRNKLNYLRRENSKAIFSFFIIRVKNGGGKVKDIEYEIIKDTVRIKLPNELDHYNAMDIRKEVDMYIYNGTVKNIEFDFSDTKFMDSSGIGLIMGRYKLIKPIGGRIILTGVKDNVERIVKVSGLYKIL